MILSLSLSLKRNKKKRAMIWDRWCLDNIPHLIFFLSNSEKRKRKKKMDRDGSVSSLLLHSFIKPSIFFLFSLGVHVHLLSTVVAGYKKTRNR